MEGSVSRLHENPPRKNGSLGRQIGEHPLETISITKVGGTREDHGDKPFSQISKRSPSEVKA